MERSTKSLVSTKQDELTDEIAKKGTLPDIIETVS
jgi:hypothetical protein